MSLATLLNRSCTITPVTFTGSDEYNDLERTDGTPVDTYCYVEQRRASEDTVNTQTESEDWLVMLPADTEIAAPDRITVGDMTLEVLGPPWPAYNPRTMAVSHIECMARQVV